MLFAGVVVSFLERNHTSAHFGLLIVAGLYFCYAYADAVVRRVFTVEVETVAVITFCDIGYVESSDLMLCVPI